MHHPTDKTVHNMAYYTSRGALAERNVIEQKEMDCTLMLSLAPVLR